MWIDWVTLIVVVTWLPLLGWRLTRVERGLTALGVSLVATFNEMKEELAAINEVTNEIVTDIEIAKLAEGKVLTEAEATEILDGLKSVATSLRDVASKYTPEG